jgi:citrate synthase
MPSQLILKAAELMHDQAAAYKRLDSLCQQLSVALVRGAPEPIESLTRTGESELLKMRSRLGQIVSTLTAFAEKRGNSQERSPIDSDARASFEAASKELMEAAESFRRTTKKSVALSRSGSSFASNCIEMCGVPPTTYRSSYTSRGDTKAWA